MSANDKPIYSQARHDEVEPGNWSLLQRQVGDTAFFACPNCGQLGSLAEHAIDESGSVSPSVVCLYMGCAFHEHVQLSGWEQRRDNRWQKKS